MKIFALAVIIVVSIVASAEAYGGRGILGIRGRVRDRVQMRRASRGYSRSYGGYYYYAGNSCGCN